ncbi:MAG: hypothetical protein IPJ90_07430 [Anaerolineaceae bacterium]|nr:hypothetical protein [Anaerolineaceae bacterium]
MEQVASQIGIKGIREGLLISVPDRGSLADLVALLTVELAQKRAFLQGSQVALQVGYRKLDKEQVRQLQAVFEQNQLELWAILAEDPSAREAARELSLATRLSGSQTDLNGNFFVAGGGAGNGRCQRLASARWPHPQRDAAFWSVYLP